MPDTAHPHPLSSGDWSGAFASLPLEVPPADGWQRLSRALDQQTGAKHPVPRRMRWLAIAAALALVALAPVMLMRERDTQAPASPSVAVADVPDATVPRNEAAKASTPLPAPALTPAVDSPSSEATASVAERQAAARTPHRIARSTPKKPPATPAPTTLAPAASIAASDEPASAGTAAAVATVDASKSTSSPSDALLQLQAESARLEALIAMTRDERVGSAAATVMTAELDQRVGLIDAGLTQSATLTTEQHEALWRERVQTLRELAGVETTQLWLAAQGESYDGALVSVD